MYKPFVTTIAACLYYSGLVGVCRWWAERARHRLVILCYHHASGGDLQQHLLYLRQYYRLLPLEEALEELYQPRKKELSRRDRRTLLALTFDDGYYDNYTHALVLANELQVPITIFLIPGYIETGKHFWWQEGEHIVSSAQVKEVTVEKCTYHLDKVDERKKLTQFINTCVRYATSVSAREQFLSTMYQLLAVSSKVTNDENAFLPLTWTEIQKMEESGWVSFGAHTMHHPILAYLTNLQEVQYEVNECRTILELHLKHPVRTFAYPVGKFEHIGEQALLSVQKAGYEWSLTTMSGFNTLHTSPYLLRRLEVDVSEHWLVIAARVCGLGGFLSRFFGLPATFLQFIRTYICNYIFKHDLK